MKSMLKDAGILFAITLVAGLLLGCVYQNVPICIHNPEICILKGCCRGKSQGEGFVFGAFYSLTKFIFGNQLAGSAVKGLSGRALQPFFYQVGATGGKQQKADSAQHKVQDQQFSIKMLFHESFTSNL